MTDGSRAFLNVTHNTLKRGYLNSLPKKSVVIEILQPLAPDAELASACQKLQRTGYTLAMKDFACEPDFEPLLETVGIIKVDVLTTSRNDCYESAEVLHDIPIEEDQKRRCWGKPDGRRGFLIWCSRKRWDLDRCCRPMLLTCGCQRIHRRTFTSNRANERSRPLKVDGVIISREPGQKPA